LGGAFRFVINGTTVKASAGDAAALSPAVGLQLSVGACVRKFAVEDGEVNPGRFPFSGAFPLPLNRVFRPPFAIPIPIRRGGR
jgi:hypothetical protein